MFEDLLNLILLKCIKKKISKNLVYAGGCALNSLANKKFLKRDTLIKYTYLTHPEMVEVG